MHFVPFAFKRAHYTSLAVTRDLAHKFGLTPARFDFFACVRKLGRNNFQAAVARALGVSEVTVSRMVRALEKRGLVRRVIYPYDTRKRGIKLTNQGRRRYFLLLQKLKGRKPLKVLFQSLAAKMMHGSYEEALLWLSGYVSFFRSILTGLGDRSNFNYPDWDLVCE